MTCQCKGFSIVGSDASRFRASIIQRTDLMRKFNILLATIVSISTWMFVGIFRDDEFYEPTIFVKHRPSLKVNFYSPIGMSDLKFEDLTPVEQSELVAFDEFVVKQGIQYNSNRLWYLPFVLVQMVLTFLTFGILNSKGNKVWRHMLHFSICVLPSSIGLAFILAFDRMFTTVFLGFLIFAVNCFVLYLLTMQGKRIGTAS